MALTYQQTRLVRGTIPALREHGERITTIFYREMLREHPELNNYFNSVNQANGRQPRALTAVILNFASNINNFSELIPKLERMCHKHFSLGIQPEHYKIVGKYLIQAFGEVLGPAMTPEVEAAWTKAYWLLAKMLIGRESQMYKEFENWKGWRKFKIEKKVAESDDLFSFYLVPKDGKTLPDFEPGQYVSVRLDVPSMGYVQSRQYSLSEMPRPDYYRISIKRDRGMKVVKGETTTHVNPGVVSNLLIDQKKPGDELELSHPAGDIFLDTTNASNVPLVLISAGVGITPMVCILNTVNERQPGRPISFIHGAHRIMPFEEHIRKLERQCTTIKTNIFKSKLADTDLIGVNYDYDVRVDLAKLHPDDLYLDNSSAEYYMCGPEQFMVEMSEYLVGKGVSLSRVKFELFSTGDLETKKPGLANVNGMNGVNGSAGIAVSNGANGIKGAPKINGINGMNGVNGLNGHPVGYPVSRASGALSGTNGSSKVNGHGMNGGSRFVNAYNNW